MSRRRRAALAVALLVAGILLIWLGTREPSAAERDATAEALMAGIRASVTVDDARLLAARAIADFGVGEDVRLVRVRIVDVLRIQVRIESPSDIVLAGEVRACLVGPDAAPDDAGLSDRCWGEPDLGPLVAAALTPDERGRFRLPAGAPVTLTATIDRGTRRCDYPPGAWRLELRLDPVVGGGAAGPRYAPDASFEVTYEPDEALRMVEERRYCGLASAVYREQGEPAVLDE